jgi:transposase
MSDSEIIKVYRGLWKIEESFKITKSELKNRPVHVSTKEHIEAHFLTCFFALLLLRLVEMKTGHKHSTKTLINEMKKITGTYLDENYYMLDHYNATVEDLGNAAGIDFTKRFMTLGEIKKILAETKK